MFLSGMSFGQGLGIFVLFLAIVVVLSSIRIVPQAHAYVVSDLEHTETHGQLVFI